MDPLVALSRANAMKGKSKTYWERGISLIPSHFVPLVLILIALSYGVLIAWVAFDDFSWIAFGELSGFFVAIGTGQFLLYRRNNPRKTAILTGAVFGFTLAAVALLVKFELDSKLPVESLPSNMIRNEVINLYFDLVNHNNLAELLGRKGSEWFNLLVPSMLYVIVFAVLGYIAGCIITLTLMSLRWVRSALEASDLILPEWAVQQKRELSAPKLPKSDSDVLGCCDRHDKQ